ncbi:TPA: hypothetical protein EYN23_26225 [Candidatus Poribacteria bacterium]|nr:hypothetical protein [Candidatus Poribacteria bacterium]
MVSLDDIYAFSSQQDIDRISLSVRDTEGRTRLGGGTGGNRGKVIFAKVTELVDEIDSEDTNGKVAKGIEYFYDSTVFEKDESVDPRIFDDEDTTINKTGYIYSDTALSIGQIVEVFKYNDPTLKADQKNNMQWLVRSGGGGDERPVIMSAGSNFEFGAIITSPTDLAPITIFTEEDDFTFKSIMPWGATVDLPADYRYIADLVDTNYFDQDYPKTLWARPTQSYPASGGITSFDIYDARTTNGNILDGLVGSELILEDFDNSEASSTAKNYFNGKFFACSYNHNDGNFYFDHPLF